MPKAMKEIVKAKKAAAPAPAMKAMKGHEVRCFTQEMIKGVALEADEVPPPSAKPMKATK